MIVYESKVLKALQKRKLPLEVYKHIHNAFTCLEVTKDFSLFDIRRLKGNEQRTYFRLRKGNYRAIFFTEEDDIYVIKIEKREDVYK